MNAPVRTAPFQPCPTICLEPSSGEGAWRTVRANVLRWERLESFCADDVPCPPLVRHLIRFSARAASLNCGPMVIPAFCAAATWIARRLGMALPEVPSPIVLAIQENLVSQRGAETKLVTEDPRRGSRVVGACGPRVGRGFPDEVSAGFGNCC